MQFHFSVMQPAIKQSRPCGFASGHGKEEKKKLRLQPKSDKNDDSIGCHSFFFFSFLGIHDCSFVKERSPVLSFELEQFHCGKRKKKKRSCRSKKKNVIIIVAAAVNALISYAIIWISSSSILRASPVVWRRSSIRIGLHIPFDSFIVLFFFLCFFFFSFQHNPHVWCTRLCSPLLLLLEFTNTTEPFSFPFLLFLVFFFF